MARPREFDRDQALDKAMDVFWGKGFAATSTDDLLRAMGIARQSLYNAFGDKRQLYLEVLETYQQRSTGGHLARLNGATSPIEGLRALLVGLAPEDDYLRGLGCMGVGSVGEFGVTDPAIVALRAKASPLLVSRLAERIREGQALGEIDPGLSPDEAAGFVLMTMTGLQVAARGGSDPQYLATMAEFAVARLKPH